MHFLEALERELDFQKEYEKLERMIVLEEHYDGSGFYGSSINNWIEKHFREWKERGNYTSFNEIREWLGFTVDKYNDDLFLSAHVDMGKYFTFCEMIITITSALGYKNDIHFQKPINAVIDTMLANINKAGFELKIHNKEFIVVEKNPVASEVAEIVPNLADVIIEYNRYLLRGNLKRKKEILKRISDALEPRRNYLKQI